MSHRHLSVAARGSRPGQMSTSGDAVGASSPYAITGLGREILEEYLASTPEPLDPEETGPNSVEL
ncbi:MAG: hypothetical protein QOJ29_2415 [Thermoleophilaceae bacterium]|nr:hypothetical protein [Thermoleophilaceae bacterium]